MVLWHPATHIILLPEILTLTRKHLDCKPLPKLQLGNTTRRNLSVCSHYVTILCLSPVTSAIHTSESTLNPATKSVALHPNGKCFCGNQYAVLHIINNSPQTKPEGASPRLHLADDVAVSVTTYGLRSYTISMHANLVLPKVGSDNLTSLLTVFLLFFFLLNIYDLLKISR